MKFLIIVLLIILGTFTDFMIRRQKLIRKVRQEMNDIAKYSEDYKQRLMDEGILEDYKSKSREELQNELSNLQYRLDNLKYPEDKTAILEADQRKMIIEELLSSMEQ